MNRLIIDGRTPANEDFAALLPVLERYREPSFQRSIWQLLSSILSFFALWTLMWFTLRYGYWLTLILAVPAAGFMLRIFMIQHDCGHGAFFKSKAANDWLGIGLGVLTFTPYYHWRRNHALHHAGAGNLARRGGGDIHTLTVKEYLALPSSQRFAYRVLRNPFFLFGLAPVMHFVIRQRFPSFLSRRWPKERVNVHVTNLLLVLLLGGLWLTLGWRALVLIHLPIVVIGGTAGFWLFFVQHHFHDTYWQKQEEWKYLSAGLQGSSYYPLPPVLQWFTANIGFHHIHHLDSRIPNYRLEECFSENPCMQNVKGLTLRKSFSCAWLALWDEEKQKMVGFKQCNPG